MVYNWFCEFERKFQSIINLIFIMDLIILLCHESCNSISTSQCVFNKDIYNTNFPYSIIVSYNYQIIKYFLIKKMAYYLFFKVVVRYKRGQILQIEYYNPSYKLQQWNFLKKEKRKKKKELRLQQWKVISIIYTNILVLKKRSRMTASS